MPLCRAVLLSAALISLSVSASGTTLIVDGKANIFGAGHASPPAPGGDDAGLLPPVFSFPAAIGQVLTFSSVSGTVSCCNSSMTGPDGGPYASGTTDITSYGGISGVLDDHHTMFLVGVFLDDNEPVDPAPARLDFSPSQLGEGFVALSPQVGQVFFIGDGLSGTGGGATQMFFAPATATRLYLGFADAEEFGNPTSPPGFYGDNLGSLTALFDLQPLVVATHSNSWGQLKISYR
jgi:hypothetical protein